MAPDPLRDAVAALRRPEYVGENRCLACTTVNAALVAVIGAALRRRSRILAAVAVGVGGLLIVVRGYVVPGTPRFAPALTAPLPVAFGHERPYEPSGSLAADPDPEDVMNALVAAGVVVPDGEELLLDGSFRADWTARAAELRGLPGEELAARAAAASPEPVEGRVLGDRVLLAGGRDVRLSRAVAIAETAAVEALADRGVSEAVRAAAARPLRTFVRTCPACGGDVRETTLRNCCGGPGSLRGDPERTVLACADCEAVVFEFERASASDGTA